MKMSESAEKEWEGTEKMAKSKDETPDLLSVVLVIPMAVIGIVGSDIVAMVLAFVMFCVATEVKSAGLRLSILLPFNLVILYGFVAAYDLDGEDARRHETMRLEYVAKYNLQHFSAEVSTAWGDEGFETGHMMADRRVYYAGLLGGPRHPHLPSGDLPCFSIYDTRIDNVNVSKLPDPGIPFAMEI